MEEINNSDCDKEAHEASDVRKDSQSCEDETSPMDTSDSSSTVTRTENLTKRPLLLTLESASSSVKSNTREISESKTSQSESLSVSDKNIGKASTQTCSQKGNKVSQINICSSAPYKITSFFPSLKQEGGAKMSSNLNTDSKPSTAPLKPILNKDAMPSSSKVKSSEAQVIPPMTMPLSKMANLKNVLSSVMKTSISQVLRNKIDSSEKSNLSDRSQPERRNSKETDSASKDSSKNLESEILKNKTSECSKNEASKTEENKVSLDSDTSNNTILKSPEESKNKVSKLSVAMENKSSESATESMDIKVQDSSDNKVVAETSTATVDSGKYIASEVENIIKDGDSEDSNQSGSKTSRGKKGLQKSLRTVSTPSPPIIVTRNQAAHSMKFKKTKRRHFKGATYNLYLSPAKKKKKLAKKLSGSKDDESSIGGTETGSFVDSDENSLASDDYSQSEKSYHEDCSNTGISNSSFQGSEKNTEISASPEVHDTENTTDNKDLTLDILSKEAADTVQYLLDVIQEQDDINAMEEEEEEEEELLPPIVEEEPMAEEVELSLTVGNTVNDRLNTTELFNTEESENELANLEESENDLVNTEEFENEDQDKEENSKTKDTMTINELKVILHEKLSMVNSQVNSDKCNKASTSTEQEKVGEETPPRKDIKLEEDISDTEEAAIEETNAPCLSPATNDATMELDALSVKSLEEPLNMKADILSETEKSPKSETHLDAMEEHDEDEEDDDDDIKEPFSIATSVKFRQRIKRRLTDELLEDNMSAVSLPSVHSDGGSKKTKKSFASESMMATLGIIESMNKGPPKLDIVYDMKLGAITSCTCLVPALEDSEIDETRIYCQAIDSIDGRLVGCYNYLVCHRLVRPSVKVPFSTMCEYHQWRLRHHHCCPICGLFCTQGSFYQCSSIIQGKRHLHFFHKTCAVLIDPSCPPLCPHCGLDSNLKSVSLEFHTPVTPTFYLHQKAHAKSPKAKMSITPFDKGEQEEEGEEMDEEHNLPKKFFTIPDTGKVLSVAGLPAGEESLQLQSFLVALTTDKSYVTEDYTIDDLYTSAQTGDVEKVLEIIANGVDPNRKFPDHDNDTALHSAAASGELVTVHILVQAGADINIINDRLYTPLMVATESCHTKVMEYLIKAGCQLDCRGEDGMTALHIAAKSGNLDVCKVILNTGGFDINGQDEGGWTPAVWAAEHSHADIVKLLLARGADPLIRDKEENIALHWSAFSGSIDISQLFLDKGCDITATNERGDTPLHVAARQDKYECVVLFLARGADITALNKQNEVPLMCCPFQSSQTWMALRLNEELKRLTSRHVHRAEKVLHRDISRGKEQNAIQCVNGIDDERAPADFLYIVENCETSPIAINRNISTLQRCECEDDCTSPKCTCSRLSFMCWYDKEGHLLPEFNMLDPPMLFECNRSCFCWTTCNNRVLQHGITCRLQLFRTKGKGWGVRTLKDIAKGTFICEYIGEIISDSEADNREDDSYLFDLDNRDEETYCLDARNYGNISRFINHLCEPNLVPIKIFVEHQDVKFPRIAFFSSRDVKACEELGFDYGEKFWVIKYKWFTCGCGSPKCKYSKDTIHETLANYYKRLREEQDQPDH